MAYSGWFFSLYVTFIFFISIALILLLFTPLTLRIKLHNLRDDNIISLWAGFIVFRKYKIFILRKIWQAEPKHQDRGEIYRRLSRIYGKFNAGQRKRQRNIFLSRFFKAVSWHEFTVILKAGSGDPATTGLMLGLAQIFGTLITLYLRQYWHFAQNIPRFLLYPSFTDKEFKYFISLEFTTGLARLFKNMVYPGYN